MRDAVQVVRLTSGLNRRELAGKTFLTEAEAAEYQRRTLERVNADRRDGRGTQRAAGEDTEVARAYNEFWYERGSLTEGRRTSLIVDPPDGKLPPMTPLGKKRADALNPVEQEPAPAVRVCLSRRELRHGGHSRRRARRGEEEALSSLALHQRLCIVRACGRGPNQILIYVDARFPRSREPRLHRQSVCRAGAGRAEVSLSCRERTHAKERRR